MIDNEQMELITAKLESLDDESLAVNLLKEFNEKTSSLGKLIMNQDPNLSHVQWKKKCDEAQKEVDKVVEKILNL